MNDNVYVYTASEVTTEGGIEMRLLLLLLWCCHRDSVTSRVHPVHLTYADQRQTAADPQTRPTDLGCKSACRLLYGLHTSSPFKYYSARKLILILPSHGGWKAEST